MNVDDGLEDIRWIRGLGGEKLPAASNALLPNLKKGLFFAIGEGSRNCVPCFLHSNAQMCLYQTPGRRPQRITGGFVNTVTGGGSEPLTSAPRSDFMAQSMVLSIDVCRGLRISSLRMNVWLSFCQADLGPRSAQDPLSPVLNDGNLFPGQIQRLFFKSEFEMLQTPSMSL